ncbi:MAG TPA: c-type cytochrome [Xanthobacteraceae bacterium]|nr:c-type cytochrome [Xanthobacteraceae bacterium]
MPRHIFRLILLLVACVVIGYAATRALTVKSFYEYGVYRGDSVAQIASEKPKYKGVGNCAWCHAEQVAEWSKGVHNSVGAGKVVKCEVCHGPAGERDERGTFVISTSGPDHPTNLKMSVATDTRKLCTLCHERLTGRPAQQPQIAVADHAGAQQCIICHNPHSPTLNLVFAEAAAPAGDALAGMTKSAACTVCHGAGGVSKSLPGPSLAGQNASYFANSLKAYGTGARSNPMMSAVAQAMKDEDAGDLAAYFADLKCESAPLADHEAASRGQAILSKCAACHGTDGHASNRSWPNLAGLSRDYLIDALRAYKDGTRSSAIMAGIVKDLSDSDAESASAYYAGVGCK